MQGPVDLSPDHAGSPAAPRGRVRYPPFSYRLFALPAVRRLLGKDIDDVARAARHARSPGHDARIRDDAADIDFGRATGADALGELVWHGPAWPAEKPPSPREWRRWLYRLSRPRQPGKGSGPGHRNRASGAGAAADRGQGRRGRSGILREQDRAAIA